MIVGGCSGRERSSLAVVLGWRRSRLNRVSDGEQALQFLRRIDAFADVPGRT